MKNLQLIKISADDDKIELLYTFLKNRKKPISHQSMPSFEEHKAFVKSHPYRAWYLIKNESGFIGTIYILSNNCIGTHLEKGFEHDLPELLQLIRKKHRPLKAIKSVRGGFFSINVSPDNADMIKILTASGAKHIQSTYSIDAI